MRQDRLAVIAALLVTLLCVALFTLALSSYHSSDRVLTQRFYEHEADFYRLGKMANDSEAKVTGDEYRQLFQKLQIESVLSHNSEVTGALFLQASMDFPLIGDADGGITEKGYVYSPKPIFHSLVDSLDDLETDCPAIHFKKLNDDWYLYYECSISKPE